LIEDWSKKGESVRVTGIGADSSLTNVGVEVLDHGLQHLHGFLETAANG